MEDPEQIVRVCGFESAAPASTYVVYKDIDGVFFCDFLGPIPCFVLVRQIYDERTAIGGKLFRDIIAQ